MTAPDPGSVSPSSGSAESADRPNIVLMVAHDLGRHIGPYGRAVEQCDRLNRFAGESIRLDQHFVTSPGCSQSRASLVTGRYPHNNGQFGLAHLGWELHRDELLLPQVLRDAGYRTALLGIWHLHEWTLGAFDDVSEDVSTADSSPEGFAEVASGRAERWLTERAKEDNPRPFYLHLGFWETHRPFCGHEANPADWPDVDPDAVEPPDDLPDTEATRREFAELSRSVRMVDAAVGKVLDAIDAAGLRENTIVLFTADHGLPFPWAKGTLYDPGIAVPFLARWPGRIPAGTSAETLSSNVDVMPTLLDAVSVECPDRVQGTSFLPLLHGEGQPYRDAVHAEKTYHEHYDPIRAVRTERYKYIHNFEQRPRLVMPSDIYNSPTRKSITDDEALWSHRPPEELYDLEADPQETTNLAGSSEHHQTLRALRERLEIWMRETEDPLLHGPIPRPEAAAE